jgi:flagellar export protein FliJ
VLDKEKEEQRKIGNKVTRMRIFIESEKNQENSLHEYKDEYLQRIREQKQCAVAEINRYRNFCAQLEQALSQQKEKIRFAENNLNKLQQQLMQQQHKITVLVELIEKKKRLVQQREDNAAQKIEDELSSRRRLPGL